MKRILRSAILLSLLFFFTTTLFAARGDLAARGQILSINSAPNNRYELRMYNELTKEEYTYLVSDKMFITDGRPGHEGQTMTWAQLASAVEGMGRIEVYLYYGSVSDIIYLGP
ncbi:MAG: hypothetical protein FJZ09_06520 [Candidatus Omnitrophica bacterium]|nr:hypothetical protein [Candidatus Omnitrophota bacterium]